MVLVNEAAATKYWTTPQAAVGARLNLWGAERTVAGVIGDVRDMPWHDRAAPALYFPHPQAGYPQPMSLIARSDVEPASIVDPIRRALREMDPALPLANVRPLETVAGAAIATRRLTLWLVATFGLTSLFLAVVGIYGVMAQAVGQRTREFGVRQALGATGGDIMRLVLLSGATMTIAGLLAGVALAAGSMRLLVSLLYGVSPLDPATFTGVQRSWLRRPSARRTCQLDGRHESARPPRFGLEISGPSAINQRCSKSVAKVADRNTPLRVQSKR